MPVTPPPQIVCVECGGTAYVLHALGAEDTFQAGDVVAYRCPECLERFDVELSDEDAEDTDAF